MLQCILCGQSVCESCFLDEDICCLQEKRKTERFVRDFYGYKFLNGPGMGDVTILNEEGSWNEGVLNARKEIVFRSVKKYVQNFDTR